MSRDLFGRYIWIVDTIRRYGSITREELDRCWLRSPFSDGAPLPRRTFYNYRNAIEDLFKINIRYNASNNSYSIEEEDAHSGEMTDWVLNSAAMTNLLTDSRDVADKIVLEDVPSAREHLSSIVTAIKEGHPIIIDYHSYTRSQPQTSIALEPYFLKIFRQRWYVTGRNVREDGIKTYALDRITHLTISQTAYSIPDDFDAATYFRDSFGIVFNKGDVKEIILRADPRQAKYFRALPLHHSQKESVGDGYSLFSYRLKISDDFVRELLSYGAKVTVVSPPELRAIMLAELTASLANYRPSKQG